MKKSTCICIVLAMIAAPVVAESESSGREWIPAGKRDLKQDKWRSESPTGYIRVTLDMDGDGLPDEAVLVTSSDGTESGVRICLNAKGPKPESRCQIVGAGPNAQSIMGVAKRPPGCHLFTENERTGEEDGKICSKVDVLDYFRFGSSGSFFRYDSKSRQFNRYWDSD
ncbi:hypothetical protein [Stenotrophomonas sp. PS02289]|uniref:hypothetical protein n=1 Tax=Stenotrophomonas sp. PS02289 TaxID=2991422 RepID=UPI00249AC3EE|nr:hypothetical protein [Stenotrophomonas sp. PS02289]